MWLPLPNSVLQHNRIDIIRKENKTYSMSRNSSRWQIYSVNVKDTTIQLHDIQATSHVSDGASRAINATQLTLIKISYHIREEAGDIKQPKVCWGDMFDAAGTETKPLAVTSQTGVCDAGTLNIRSQPKGRNSGPPEAVNPIRAI